MRIHVFWMEYSRASLSNMKAIKTQYIYGSNAYPCNFQNLLEFLEINNTDTKEIIDDDEQRDAQEARANE